MSKGKTNPMDMWDPEKQIVILQEIPDSTIVEIIPANIKDLAELFPKETADNIDGLVNFALGSWIYLEKAHREKTKHEKRMEEIKEEYGLEDKENG